MEGTDGEIDVGVRELTCRVSPTESLSAAVLAATADATGSSVVGSPTGDDGDVLDPLYTAIDPDALDALFRSIVGGESRSDGVVTFVYEGCEVEARSDGIVTVTQHPKTDETTNDE